jgi:hypothetical protein
LGRAAVIDLALHAAAGAAIAVLVLFWPPGIVALLLATLVGFVREAEQRPLMRWRPWAWSAHAWSEWLAWPIGALVALAFC